MKELKDKTDNHACFYSDILIENRTLILSNGLSEAMLESCIIQAYSHMKENFDRRTPIIRILHCFNYKNNRPQNEHEIKIVVDPKNARPSQPFHLNLTDKSKERLESCSKCKKYFSQANHFPLSFDDIHDEKYKFSDLDKTIDKLIKKFEENGLFREFHIVP